MLRYVAVGLAVLGAGVAAAQPSSITVSAAASLADVLQQLAAVYERRAAEKVVLNLGASNVLARQIAAGARVDLYISADMAQMDAVAAYIDTASRVALLSNQLAVAVADDRPRRLSSIRELADPAFRRIAIGDPAAVPAGVYAKAYLETAGVWNSVTAKLVPCGSVRLALAAVENGAADAAIVYKTDIETARRAREAFVVPAAEGPRILYPAAVVNRGSNPAGARRFLDFLRSDEAAAVFQRAGFPRP
jgi:molybdate transport system substrate-binding protein